MALWLTPEGALQLVAHICSAGLVTVHTLLRKRDVPASIGWIGLAWLAPFVGALLYFAFGVNRVRRRARRRKGGDPRPVYQGRQGGSDDPLADLETAIGAVTRHPPTPGKVAAVLYCGDAGYPQMLAAIEGARTCVRLATFIFRVDDVGRQFIAALAAAKRRGVA